MQPISWHTLLKDVNHERWVKIRLGINQHNQTSTNITKEGYTWKSRTGNNSTQIATTKDNASTPLATND
jgi:hypothetical protein